MEYKRLIAGFSQKEGKTGSWNGTYSYEEDLTGLFVRACDNGADEVLIWDRSETDEDHEAVIGAIRQAARAIDAPVIAGGRVKRLEDVKKYLYAGAAAVFLDVSLESNEDMLKEAADRFGLEKIYAWLPEASCMVKGSVYRELGASMLILGMKELLSLQEMETAGLSCLIAGDGYEGEAAGSWLKQALGSSQVQGAVLSLSEEETGRLMEAKQGFKREGIPVDTFETSIQWKDFKKNENGLVPVIVQDHKTEEVLMLAYMNEEAFCATLFTGRMTYFSRSRQELWIKGATSGHFQYVKSLRIDCDKDTILAKVRQVGAACHTGNRSCFFTTLAEKEDKKVNPLRVFEDVFQVILDRKEHPKEGSYTNYLFDKGIDKILKKLGEEATEIVIAAKNPDPEEIKYEIADFLYHMMVLMAEKGLSWEEITEELANR